MMMTWWRRRRKRPSWWRRQRCEAMNTCDDWRIVRIRRHINRLTRSDDFHDCVCRGGPTNGDTIQNIPGTLGPTSRGGARSAGAVVSVTVVAETRIGILSARVSVTLHRNKQQCYGAVRDRNRTSPGEIEFVNWEWLARPETSSNDWVLQLHSWDYQKSLVNYTQDIKIEKPYRGYCIIYIHTLVSMQNQWSPWILQSSGSSNVVFQIWDWFLGISQTAEDDGTLFERSCLNFWRSVSE